MGRRVQSAQAEQHRRRGPRDQRDREEVHHDQADREQEGVDPRGQRQRGGDLPSPGEVGRVRGDQHEREEPEGERRRVEDVDPPAFAVPADQLLAQEADRDHQELQVEPVVPEPEEEVDAEDDREGPEAQRVALSPGPREQHVEGVREEELRGDERGHLVHGPPEPPPVGENRELAHRLDVVLSAQHRRQRPARALPLEPGEEDRLPRQQDGPGAPERQDEPRVRLDPRRQGQSQQPERQRERNVEGEAGRRCRGAPAVRGGGPIQVLPRARAPASCCSHADSRGGRICGGGVERLRLGPKS